MTSASTAAARFWGTKDIKHDILSRLPPAYQSKILTLDKQTFPLVAGLLWKSTTYQKYEEVAVGCQDQARLEIYTQAIQELDMRSTLALLEVPRGFAALYDKFPSLKRIRYSSWDVRRYRRAGINRVKVLRTLYRSDIGVAEPLVPSTEDLHLPEDWVIEKEELALYFNHAPGITSTPAWWPGGTISPNSLLTSEHVKEILWDRQYDGLSPLLVLLEKRAGLGHYVRKLRICRDEDGIELDEVLQVFKLLGNGIEELDVGDRSLFMSLRDIFQIPDWHLMPNLKSIRIPCRAVPLEQDEAINQEQYRTGARLIDHGPPARHEYWTVPVKIHQGQPLDLGNLTIVLQDWGYGHNLLDMVDNLPRMAEIARAMLAIGGPKYHYFLDIVEKETAHRDVVHTVQQTINVMLQREIHHLVGRRVMPRVAHPAWRKIDLVHWNY